MKEIHLIRKIFKYCEYLCLPITTCSIALTLFHRYLNFIDINEIIKKEIISISTIIFLSCKVDENIRSIREVLSVVRKLNNQTKDNLFEEDKRIKILKNEVILHEQVILRAIQFKTHVDVPHKYLLNISRTLSLNCSTVKIAWGLLNDSYLSSDSLLYHPSILSCACIYIAIECFDNPIEALQSNTNSIITNYFENYQIQLTTNSWWNLLGIDDQQFWDTVDCLTNLQYSMIDDDQSSDNNHHYHNINNNNNDSTSVSIEQEHELIL